MPEARAIKGCLVSIDAMGCQREIAKTIRERRADHLLTVKNNQRTLRRAVDDAFTDVPMDGFEHTDRGHGRILLQYVEVTENVKHADAGTWSDRERLGRVVSLRVEGDKRPVIETRCYICSAELTHEQLHAAVRQHWGIENQLHWSLDVTFREDDIKIRKDNGPRNIALIRKIILNMLRQDKKWTKTSLRGRRKVAG